MEQRICRTAACEIGSGRSRASIEGHHADGIPRGHREFLRSREPLPRVPEGTRYVVTAFALRRLSSCSIWTNSRRARRTCRSESLGRWRSSRSRWPSTWRLSLRSSRSRPRPHPLIIWIALDRRLISPYVMSCFWRPSCRWAEEVVAEVISNPVPPVARRPSAPTR